MADVAYEFERFAAKTKAPVQKSRLKVAVKENAVKVKNENRAQLMKTVRTLLAAMVVVVLVCGVLYTQTNISELQSQIDTQNQALLEEESLYAYLSFELESMTNVRNVEQRAAEMGLVEMNSSQITYVRVDDEAEIEVRQDPIDKLLSKAQTGFLTVMDYLNP